jgi:dUTP pyrophosphatase
MKVCLLTSTAKVPRRAHVSDAGLDLFSDESMVVNPGDRVAVRTGVSLGVPTGYVGLIWEKSGLALKHGLHCMGGVIDSGYTGEIRVILYNSSNSSYTIQQGHKIAQLLLQQVYLDDITVVDTLLESDRGQKGFGSTGKI